MWDLPGPGLEPMSPALGGGFLTTAPPGKSLPLFSLTEIFIEIIVDSHAVVNITLYPVPLNSNILKNYSTISQLGY